MNRVPVKWVTLKDYLYSLTYKLMPRYLSTKEPCKIRAADLATKETQSWEEYLCRRLNKAILKLQSSADLI